MQSYVRLTLAAAAITMLSACASIVGSPTQVIPIASQPDGATIEITDEKGAKVFSGNTPTNVTLKKSEGYFGGKTYNVAIAKPGYKSTEIKLVASPNGWYIGGNILFGGLIGWLVVDPLTGSMYTLSPETVSSSLETQTAAAKGAIHVVLLGDVPEGLRGEMQRVN